MRSRAPGSSTSFCPAGNAAYRSSPAAPSLAADYFGPKALGSVIGALYSGVAFGSLLGSPAAGYAYDFFGSYTGVILIGAALVMALSMGIRQSLSLFLPPVTKDLGITAADFT